MLWRRNYAILKNQIQQPASEDIFEGIKTKLNKKDGFKDWLRDIKQKLVLRTVGPLFMGDRLPFPHNPTFVPQPPIPEALKVRLYQMYKTDPKEWSPRKLSAQFKVAIPRIKAIIKMKDLELQQIADGKLIPDPQYISKMENILAAKTPISMEKTPIIENSIAQHLRPMFVAMPESSAPLTPEEAAKILGRPLSIEKTLENENSETIEEELKVESELGKFIRFDPYEKSRVPFFFVDTSSGPRPRVRTLLVRESNGDLRTANGKERLYAARKVWGKSAKQFMA